ncbi:MAG: hypothetical protein JSV21_05180 [Nitrospirota bacterium]|nr:MAG: hypothetical protein JSV21_05180 [Nitrospirota bacterium]
MDPILSTDIKEKLIEEFASLSGNVDIHVYTAKGINDKYNEYAVKICEEFSGLSEKISYEEHDLDSDEARRYGVKSSPSILFSPDRYGIMIMGAPLGEEGRSFVAAIVMVSSGKGILSESSDERLRGLKDKREIMVFVTPT